MRNRRGLYFGLVVWVAIMFFYFALFAGSGDQGSTDQPTPIRPRPTPAGKQLGQAAKPSCHDDELMEEMDKLLAQIAKLEGDLATAVDERDNAKTEVENSKAEIENLKVQLKSQQVGTLEDEPNKNLRKEKTENNEALAGGTCELPKVIVPIKMRNELGDILRRERKEYGVEIGVSKGQFAQQILKRWINFKKYHLVDVWEPTDHYVDKSNLNKQGYSEILAATHGRMDKYGDRVQFIKNFSSNAVKLFADESLDFVYVDARHDYGGVYEDLTMFWPKLKKGGIIAGHDYLNQDDLMRIEPNGKQDWTVLANGSHTVDGRASRAAAEDFSVFVGRQMAITYQDETNGNYPTYYMRK